MKRLRALSLTLLALGCLLPILLSAQVYPVRDSDITRSHPHLANRHWQPAVSNGGDTAWVRRYDGTSHSSDGALALAVDGVGNVYVTGGAHLINPDKYSYLTIKYNQNGDTLWTRRWSGGGDRTWAWGCRIAVDPLGNTVVVGKFKSWQGIEYACHAGTVKYYPDGGIYWTRGGDGTVNYDAWPISLDVDRVGNVYVGGSYGSIVGQSYSTTKYNPMGDVQWRRLFNSIPAGNDEARALAADSQDNVYVTGVSQTSSYNYDYATIKYDSAGDTLWVRTYDSPDSSRDVANALALNPAGYIYVTGESYLRGSGRDYVTIKYNSSGDTIWTRRYDAAGLDDCAHHIAIARTGNVVVTGSSTDSSGRSPFTTLKYSPDGALQWVRYCYSGHGSPAALAVDNSGNVYITGSSSSGATSNYLTVSYDSAGNTRWSMAYDGPASSYDYARGIAIDNSGNVYVTGESYGVGTYSDYATIKYVQTGDIEEERTANRGHPGLGIMTSPNPFRDEVDIRCTIQDTRYKTREERDQKAEARLQIYDVAGTLVESFAIANNQLPITIHWNACDHQGAALPAGVYFVQLRCGASSQTAKVLLLR